MMASWTTIHADTESLTDAMEVGDGVLLRTSVKNQGNRVDVSIVFAPGMRLVGAELKYIMPRYVPKSRGVGSA